MPVYRYKAIAANGKTYEDNCDADSPKEARLALRTKGIHVVELTESRGSVVARGGRKTKMGDRKKKVAEISLLTRQLATLIDSGIQVADAFKVLSEQIEDPGINAAFRAIRESITSGATLADAMSQHPQYFSDLYVNMIRAGEAAGALGTILARLADFLQQQGQMQNKIKSAMMYPMIMAIVGVGVVAILVTFIVPKITEIILKQGKTLPLPTQILVSVSAFCRGYWWAILGAVVMAIVIWKLLLRTEKMRLWYDTYILRVPVLGDLLKKSAVSRFAITFSTLLKSGIPALQALDIVKTIVNNLLLANTLAEVRDRIMEGADISTPLKKSGVFPPVVGYMIAVGEQSGRLEQILERISEAYDEEIDFATQRFTALLEPVMIVVMAVVVGFIVLATILPILEMSQLKRG